ncbi:MAG: sulfopyruvate decarboxylase subunit alpha [Acidimicrobiales bacterium]
MRTVTSDSGLLDHLLDEGYDFFTGVPDSGLKHFISDLGSLPAGRHVTATWEAEAVAIGAGASLAGAKACVYLQNAGLGHTINPLASLCIPYGIDLLLVVGHRHTLPQHRVMGEIDEALLNLVGWRNCILVAGENNEG